MSEETETAGRYRRRADRLRAIAAEDVRQENRDLLRNVADDFERMARDLEAIDQLNRSIPKAIPRIRVSS
jgi:hypothetical protein